MLLIGRPTVFMWKHLKAFCLQSQTLFGFSIQHRREPRECGTVPLVVYGVAQKLHRFNPSIHRRGKFNGSYLIRMKYVRQKTSAVDSVIAATVKTCALDHNAALKQ